MATAPYAVQALDMRHSLSALVLVYLATGCAHGRASSGPGYISQPSVASGLRAERDELCKGLKEKQCGDRMMSLFNQRLTLTYWAADGQGLGARCAAYPAQCTPEVLEQWAIESHNSNLQRLSEQQQRQRMAQASQALGALSRTLSGPPTTVQCVSQPPLVPGGPVNTVCK